MIKLLLTPWEVMVLRAALVQHAKNSPPKHVEACRAIEYKTRAQDFPSQRSLYARELKRTI